MWRTDLQVAPVDLVDNFQVTGQQMSKQLDWPALQSFREDCVIGVSAGAHTDVPGLHNNKEKHDIMMWRQEWFLHAS